MGKFLFLPMTLAVMFAMTTAYLLSRTLVPCAAYLLAASDHGDKPPAARSPGPSAAGRDSSTRRFASMRVASRCVCGIASRPSSSPTRLLAVVLVVMLPILRRDFFPEVDSGSVRDRRSGPEPARGSRITEFVKKVDKFVRENIEPEDLQLTICEIGTSADWSAAYTANSGPMDALVKVQLNPERHHTSQEYIRKIRKGLTQREEFSQLEFSFDSGGLIRGALNEGRSSPINIQLVGKNQHVLFKLADKILKAVKDIDGIVDARVLEKAERSRGSSSSTSTRRRRDSADLSQSDVMKNVIAATNSSIMATTRSRSGSIPRGQPVLRRGVRSIPTRTSRRSTTSSTSRSPGSPTRSLPCRSRSGTWPRSCAFRARHRGAHPRRLAAGHRPHDERRRRDLGHVSEGSRQGSCEVRKEEYKDDTWTPTIPSSEQQQAARRIEDRSWPANTSACRRRSGVSASRPVSCWLRC